MRFDDVLRSPALREALSAGEKRVGRVLTRLLGSERVTSGISRMVSGALQARGAIDRGVKGALHAANLPSREDVDALRQKLDDLEATLDGLTDRVKRPGGSR
jgi:hypothetical protein